MNSLLDKLNDHNSWIEFQDHKINKRQLNRYEERKLALFINEKKYLFFNNDYHFSYPEKKILSKLDSKKKRIVYSYKEEETWILKHLAYLLYEYDNKLSDNCYSFRRNINASHAFKKIKAINDVGHKYVLKLDIHDYFNSINITKLLDILKNIIYDKQLLDLFDQLLNQDRCFYKGELIKEKRGAMAGVPLASFFANFYLLDLDMYFQKNNIPYFRYSDDMIIFSDSEKQLRDNYDYIENYLHNMDLTFNKDKFQVSSPGEQWEFLGFAYKDGQIDLSDITIKKIKGKIRRKARKLYRNNQKKKLSYQTGMKALINCFDHKFYDFTGNNDFTWIRFYFPLITTCDGFHEIDEYMIHYLRYLYNGHHNKANYRIKYEELKKLGYTPLVSEYYRWKKENHKLNKINKKI